MEDNRLYPEEILVIQTSLQNTIEDLKDISSNPKLPFTPEARQDMRDILKFAESALAKIARASNCEIKLEPYKEGDEQQFFTKKS